MQSENYTICDDLGGFGYEIPQKKHRNEIGISLKTEAFFQSIVLKKTFESISFERRRGIEEEDGHNQVDELVSKITETPAEVKPVVIQT